MRAQRAKKMRFVRLKGQFLMNLGVLWEREVKGGVWALPSSPGFCGPGHFLKWLRLGGMAQFLNGMFS